MAQSATFGKVRVESGDFRKEKQKKRERERERERKTERD